MMQDNKSDVEMTSDKPEFSETPTTTDTKADTQIEGPVWPQEKVLKGLGNQGATCYMNSLLQALYMTPEFRSMIYKWRYDPLKNVEKKDCILYQLQKLFVTLQIGNAPWASTQGLTGSF